MRTSFFVILLTFLLATVPRAHATCDDSEPGCAEAHTEQEENIARSVVKAELQSTQFELETMGRDGAGSATSHFRARLELTGYSGGSGKILRIRVEYATQVSCNAFSWHDHILTCSHQNQITESEVSYELSPMSWIEYLDTSATPNGYDAGVDTVVSSFPMQNCNWKDFTLSTFHILALALKIESSCFVCEI